MHAFSLIFRGTLYGIVTDAMTGKGIPEFRLRYRRLGSSYYLTDGIWTQFHNDKGLFELDITGNKPAICQVQAVAEGYASQWSRPVDTASSAAAVIKLSRGGDVTGRVVDATGRPVAKATVLPLSLAGGARPTPEPVFDCEEGAVETDAEGRFALAHLAAGTETLKVTHPDYAFAMAEGIEVKEGQTADAGRIRLGRGGTVEGVVTDAQGRPQAWVTLRAMNHYGYTSSKIQYATAVTDPNGMFRMERLPEQLCYIVRPRPYQETGVVSRAVVPVDGQVRRLDFGGGPVVRGQLVIDGKPLKNTRVTLTLGDSSLGGLVRSHADTDAGGRFELQAGQAGTYMLFYEPDKQRATSVKLEEIRIDGEDVDLGTLPMAGTTVRLWVEATEAQMASSRYLFLREGDPLTGPCVYWQSEPGKAPMPWRIALSRAGTYYAVFQSGNCEYRQAIEVSGEQATMDVRFKVPSGPVTITGTLPAMMSLVHFANEDRSVSGYLHQPQDGEGFRVEGLAAGTYYFNPKWMYFGESVAVTIPEVNEYPLQLDPAALWAVLRERIFVHVFDAEGLPVEDATVWIESDGQRLLPASSTGCSHGFYLTGGEHEIHAEKDGLAGVKKYRIYSDINNTGSGEIFETFVQLGR